MRCNAITSGGNRCKLEATHGSYCWSHAPETADERSRRARRGGKAGGRGRPEGDLKQWKEELRKLTTGVLGGRLDKGAAAVAVQIYNTLIRIVEVERNHREEDDLLRRIERLERERGGTRQWR